MRCKMCGAVLKKEGDICKNCFDKYIKEETLKLDNEEEIFSIRRKYTPKFNLLKNGEFIVLEIIIILAGFRVYNVPMAMFVTFLCLIVFGIWMFFNKKRAMGTKTTFYETKLKYTAKYWFVDREEIILYNDIKDMSYFQSRSQKICKYGDIRFYTKGFLNGLTICDIPEIKENFNKMRDIINATR